MIGSPTPLCVTTSGFAALLCEVRTSACEVFVAFSLDVVYWDLFLSFLYLFFSTLAGSSFLFVLVWAVFSCLRSYPRSTNRVIFPSPFGFVTDVLGPFISLEKLDSISTV